MRLSVFFVCMLVLVEEFNAEDAEKTQRSERGSIKHIGKRFLEREGREGAKVFWE